MKNICFAIGTAYTALLAFVIVCIDNLLKGCMPIGNGNGFVYISFVAWAAYFFAGCTWKGGVKCAIGYLVGIVFSVSIFLLAGVFSSFGWFAVPVAVFVAVFLVLYLEKVPWLDLIPAIFVASGCFFGIMTYVPGATYCDTAMVEIIYGFIGLSFGWITINGKGCLEKMLCCKK